MWVQCVADYNSKERRVTPTAKLRFLEKTVHFDSGSTADGIPIIGSQKFRMLQQWWAVERDGQITPTGEWRDVPLEIQS